jgi:hypothetical protein
MQVASISRGQVYKHGGTFLAPGDTVPVKFVTVIGYAGDFAVYMGESNWTDKEVAEHGDKAGGGLERRGRGWLDV